MKKIIKKQVVDAEHGIKHTLPCKICGDMCCGFNGWWSNQINGFNRCYWGETKNISVYDYGVYLKHRSQLIYIYIC